MYQGGAAWRKRLMDDIGDQGSVTALLDRHDDDALAELMANLGGHCLQSVQAAFDAAATHDRPTVFVAYTVKGWGTPLAGHKDVVVAGKTLSPDLGAAAAALMPMVA